MKIVILTPVVEISQYSCMRGDLKEDLENTNNLFQ